MATRLNTRKQYETLIEKYDTFLFDCDGVLWNGDSIIDGIVDVLSMLRSKSTCIMTMNNLTDSP